MPRSFSLLGALLLAILPAVLGAEHQFAYAVIQYASDCGSGRSVGIRVLLRSIKNTSPNADLVVLTNANVPELCSAPLLADGYVIRRINVTDPFSSRADNYPSNFRHLLNRMIAWNLTEYKRVAIMEPYSLVLMNMDDVFQCGHFCAVDQQPVVYALDLYVVTPGHDLTYSLVLRDVLDSLNSYVENPRYGFPSSLYEHIQSAPFFKSNRTNSKAPLPLLQRLPPFYNFNHMFFYEKGDWNLYRCGDVPENLSIPALSITFSYKPVHLVANPWYWYGYGYHMSLFWHWFAVRSQLNESYPSYAFPVIFGAACFLLVHLFKRKIVQHIYPTEYCVSCPYGVSLVCSSALITMNSLLSFVFTPKLCPPVSGWIRFLFYHNLLLFVEASLIFSTRLRLNCVSSPITYDKRPQILSLIAVFLIFIRSYRSAENIVFSLLFIIFYNFLQILTLTTVIGNQVLTNKRSISEYEIVPTEEIP